MRIISILITLNLAMGCAHSEFEIDDISAGSAKYLNLDKNLCFGEIKTPGREISREALGYALAKGSLDVNSNCVGAGSTEIVVKIERNYSHKDPNPGLKGIDIFASLFTFTLFPYEIDRFYEVHIKAGSFSYNGNYECSYYWGLGGLIGRPFMPTCEYHYEEWIQDSLMRISKFNNQKK